MSSPEGTAGRGNRPDCDIIIPIWNLPELTGRCLESVIQNTGRSIRLILIDNGSEAPTREMLDQFAQAAPVPVAILRNTVNLGFIKAINQGLAAAQAPWICLLNNDTVVTAGWLTEMIRVADQDPQIGLVNPTSNSLGLSPAGRSPEAVARSLQAESGKSASLSIALGFCLLGRRSLFEEIGGLDERFGMGNFDDDDLSHRVRNSGRTIVRACGAYVYHEEKASFRRMPGWKKAFEENRRRYEAKWGRKLRILTDSPESDPDGWRRIVEAGHWLCVAGPRGNGNPFPEGQAQVAFLEGPEKSWRRTALWRLVTKRKKPFDLVVSHDPAWSRWVRRLRWLHRARLMDQPTHEELLNQCRNLSRSPSSS
ncbi:MAG: hypothetical protein COV76_01475 [Candidatus Omnitrophica bacterium CG11_big_fil_rev_8_21_14_0_20_64_10]|nr:MAG: hypothetical protein COV76_01475 [Candidatus Omnitrophica bacterium CG11_big_fil_rev_8_21_14_0_20_64_10]